MRVCTLAFSALACALLASCAPAVQQPVPPAPLSEAGPEAVHLHTDAARNEVVVTAGPFHVPAHGGGHGSALRTPLLGFEWPLNGWLQGFRITVFDETGQVLPRDVMHHLIAYNFDRRQLIHPGIERIFGIGQETDDVTLPGSYGVPLEAGTRLGFDAMWHNETGEDLHGVYIQITLPYTPAVSARRVANEVYPFHVDVQYAVGGSNEFDIPPGRTTHTVEFVMPISGGLIGTGGHLHNYGRSLRLEDVESGRTLFTLRAGTDRDGELTLETKVFRRWLGLRAAPLRLEAERRYRLVAEYDNPTGETIPRGAMAHIAGLFKPDDPAEWPVLDLEDPYIRLDLAVLHREVPRDDDGDHGHHHHH